MALSDNPFTIIDLERDECRTFYSNLSETDIAEDDTPTRIEAEEDDRNEGDL